LGKSDSKNIGQFTTKFGRSIPFVPGYEESSEHLRITYEDNNTQEGEQRGPVDFDGFLADMFSYSMMMDFFKERGVVGPWERHLDIGGADGIHSRILSAGGHVKESDSVDIVPGFSTNWQIFRYLLRHKVRGMLGKIKWKLTGRKQPFLPKPKFGIHVNYDHRYHKPSIRKYPKSPNVITGDVFDLDGKYDLITAILCIEYFDYRKLFEKVSELLDEGGHFWFLVGYWWYPINDTRVFGKFPYLAQRLTRDDVEKYLRAENPDEVDDAMRRYDYFHKGDRPLLDDLISVAREYGLHLVGAERQIPNRDSTSRALTPRYLDTFEETQLKDVLEDIHQFRPDVQLIDLQTFSVMAGFEKRSTLRKWK
jgi:SAM-dependent methyltransferase